MSRYLLASRCEKESRAAREERELLASASAALAWRREFRTSYVANGSDDDGRWGSESSDSACSD